MFDQFTETEQRHMDRALELAQRGQGYVEPNPMVGCVIARDGTIIAEGWHEKFGGPHAEAVAISGARCDVDGATMYRDARTAPQAIERDSPHVLGGMGDSP